MPSRSKTVSQESHLVILSPLGSSDTTHQQENFKLDQATDKNN